METNLLMKTALRWILEGKLKHGTPKTTWRRTAEQKLHEINYSWKTRGTIKNREQ
uniref:Uncharacterized protein n=1 Tax=Arion vulgaris TaxID=1028688 RepID=A0A0B6ZXJ8_9EUPU